jgi:homoserine dehydrogenase
VPTARAVLGDVIDAAVNLRKGRTPASVSWPGRHPPIDDAAAEYYLNLEVADEPGVLAAVAGVFGRHGVSIRAMEQEGLGAEARLVFITHTAVERDVQATMHDLRELDAVVSIVSMLRVIA